MSRFLSTLFRLHNRCPAPPASENSYTRLLFEYPKTAARKNRRYKPFRSDNLRHRHPYQRRNTPPKMPVLFQRHRVAHAPTPLLNTKSIGKSSGSILVLWPQPVNNAVQSNSTATLYTKYFSSSVPPGFSIRFSVGRSERPLSGSYPRSDFIHLLQSIHMIHFLSPSRCCAARTYQAFLVLLGLRSPPRSQPLRGSFPQPLHEHPGPRCFVRMRISFHPLKVHIQRVFSRVVFHPY